MTGHETAEIDRDYELRAILKILREGDNVCLHGPSGTGKTSILMTLQNILKLQRVVTVSSLDVPEPRMRTIIEGQFTRTAPRVLLLDEASLLMVIPISELLKTATSKLQIVAASILRLTELQVRPETAPLFTDNKFKEVCLPNVYLRGKTGQSNPIKLSTTVTLPK